MIDIESKIISCREDTNDYRLCLTREEIDEIKDIRSNTIEECINALEEDYRVASDRTKYPEYDHYCNGIEDCIDRLDGLKEQNK